MCAGDQPRLPMPVLRQRLRAHADLLHQPLAGAGDNGCLDSPQSCCAVVHIAGMDCTCRCLWMPRRRWRTSPFGGSGAAIADPRQQCIGLPYGVRATVGQRPSLVCRHVRRAAAVTDRRPPRGGRLVRASSRCRRRRCDDRRLGLPRCPQWERGAGDGRRRRGFRQAMLDGSSRT